VELFVFNNTISEVMFIVEQILDWDWLKPLSACDKTGKKTTTN
jgi:hypothetical protein